MKNRFLPLLLAATLFLQGLPALAGSFVGKDATGATKYLKADGDGSSGTPYIPHHVLTDGNNTPTVATSGADAGSNTASRLAVSSWLYGFNGTTWDRVRTGVSTAVSSLTGYLNVLPVAKYNSTPPTLSDGDAIVLQANSSGALKVDNSGVTQPVSDGGGSLTVDGSVSIGSALPAGTNYVGKTRLTDGTNDVTLKSLTNAKAVPTAIVDGNGDQITSFGGGTQYTEADTDSTITGTAVLWEDTSDTLRAVSASKPLPVNIISGAGSGGTAIQDDSAFTVATSNLTPAGGTYKSTRDSVDDGDAGTFAMTAKRGLYATLETPNADSAMDETNDAVKTVVSTALPAGTNAIGKLSANDGVDIGDVTLNNSTIAVTKSGTWDITNAGTFAVQATVAAGATNIAKAEDVASADADVGVPAMAIRKATPANTSGTDGDYEMLQMSAGRLWTSSTIDAALPAGSNVIGALSANQSVNVAQLAGTTTDTNSGNKSAGTLRVVLATDQPQLTNKLLVTPDANSAINLAQVGGSSVSTVATGVAKVGISDSGGTAFLSAANALNSTGGGIQAAQVVGQFDDTSPTSITENQFGNLRMSANRNLYGTIRDAAGNERGVNVNASNQLSVSVDNTPAVSQSGTWTVQPGNTANTTPWLVSEQAATSGGVSLTKVISAATTNATSVKASAGQVYMITASNINASPRYLKLYNKASSPTVGTDTPVLVFLIPGNTSGAGTNIPVPSCGLAFGTGIALAITTGVADNDTGAVAANDIVVNIGYK